jgi:hypothetical protein
MRFISLTFVMSFFFTVPAHASEVIVYSYDSQGRLVDTSHSGSGDSAGLEIAYQYDLAGNRTIYVVTGSKNRGQMVVVVPLNGFTVIPINP